VVRQAWRLVKAKHAAAAFDGEGARRYGGRWNSPGRPAVYAASSLSLAALEVLVHLEDAGTLSAYCSFRIEFEEGWVERIGAESLPEDWAGDPVPVSTQRIGDAWLLGGTGLLLEVPSAIIRSETTFLLNPAHADFLRLRIEGPEPFHWDPRLVRGRL
jgi:RES domain-containing protein